MLRAHTKEQLVEPTATWTSKCVSPMASTSTAATYLFNMNAATMK
ncbi:MAG: hypothetical protein ACLQVX_08240 [Limisphaerales bacterium]